MGIGWGQTWAVPICTGLGLCNGKGVRSLIGSWTGWKVPIKEPDMMVMRSWVQLQHLTVHRLRESNSFTLHASIRPGCVWPKG